MPERDMYNHVATLLFPHLATPSGHAARFVAASLLTCLAAAGHAEGNWTAAGEVATDHSSSLTAGVSLPLSGSKNLSQEYNINGYQYTYRLDGRQVTVTGAAAEGGLSYQTDSDNGWQSLFAGIYYRDNQVRPADIDTSERGTRLGLSLSAMGERDVSAVWKANGFANYVAGPASYYLRGRLLHGIGNDRYAGPELVYQGDPDYRAVQAGFVLAGLKLFGGNRTDLRIGLKKAQGESAAVYAGIELSRAFAGRKAP